MNQTEKSDDEKLDFENYFDKNTMSVHLRENAIAIAKKGTPGNWSMVKVSDNELSKFQICEFGKQILDKAKLDDHSFIEIERNGSTVVQLGRYRIVITEPPFSDGREITAVTPVAKLTLENYKLNEKLRSRLIDNIRGILIAGSPGEGKTTFARVLAEYFSNDGKIVKTVESPRDMLLSPKITQYSLNYGEREGIRDVLLLSRPDNTFFDEMRNTEDFKLYTDLRLAGVGMVGVVHATGPIDAIQRFIGRIEMGIIPQVVDTVVFIKGGNIDKVLELKMEVKVPTGMTEADLARPIIEVRDFVNGKLEYEIYSYGEHTVVIPIKKKEKKASWHFAADTLRAYFKTYAGDCSIEFVNDNRIQVFLPNEAVPNIIGPGGKNINKIEKELGLKIDVRSISKEMVVKKSGIHTGTHTNINFDDRF